jgi:transposase
MDMSQVKEMSEPVAGSSSITWEQNNTDSNGCALTFDERLALRNEEYIKEVEKTYVSKRKYMRGVNHFMKSPTLSARQVAMLYNLKLSAFLAYLKKLHPNHRDQNNKGSETIDEILANEDLKSKCEKGLELYLKTKNASCHVIAKKCGVHTNVLIRYLERFCPDFTETCHRKKESGAKKAMNDPKIRAKLEEAANVFFTTALTMCRVARKFGLRWDILAMYISKIEPDYKDKKEKFLKQMKVNIQNSKGTNQFYTLVVLSK